MDAYLIDQLRPIIEDLVKIRNDREQEETERIAIEEENGACGKIR